MSSKQFVRRFIVSFLCLLGLIITLNRVVDPFWYYRDIEIDGFNKIKTKFRRFERDVKPALLLRDQPNAVILGSSFSEIGLDPTNPYFTQHGQLNSMNFALAGAPWNMVFCAFQFAVTHDRQLKRVIIGIHPETMPMLDCAKNTPAIGQVSQAELLFSSRALSASVATLVEQKKSQPSHTKQGMYFYDREKPGVDFRFKQFFARQIKAQSECMRTSNPVFEQPKSLAATELDLSGLQSLLQTARQQHIELVLYVYPRHAFSLELDQQCGHQSRRWQVMKQIAHLNQQLSNDAVAIWQFFGYNAITAEPIGLLTAYWQDPEHFNFEMGNLMLADMFDATKQDLNLGRRIIPERIDDDYRNFLQQRAEYLQQHADFQAHLQQLLVK